MACHPPRSATCTKPATTGRKASCSPAARNGRISVLLGSTERTGVGTNVQARAVALHHLDCPWRPADLAQREGRILRQGNHNPEVEIIRYVTEGAFDAYLWQTVERKARFIAQVMRGRLDVREIEDIGETALSYSEVKALATGDPRILDKAAPTPTQPASSASSGPGDATNATSPPSSTAPATASPPSIGTSPASTPRSTAPSTCAATPSPSPSAPSDSPAAPTPRPSCNAASPRSPPLTPPTPRAARRDRRAGHHRRAHGIPTPHIRLEPAGIPATGFDITVDAVHERHLGVITRLENRVSELPKTGAEIEDRIRRLTSEANRAQAELDQPFAHADALDILADGTRRSGPPGAPVSAHGIYLEMSLVCEGHAWALRAAQGSRRS